MKIASIVGTRPNFMKLSAIVGELKKHKAEHVLIHTGQHYDEKMSKLFFDDLKLPKPDINLEVGSGSYSEQLGSIIIKLGKVLEGQKPELVIVVGDVNSTLAGALVAKQLGIKVAHVESGLRSFDMSMPEEINRMLTDRISDFLFTTEQSANKNLMREGAVKNKIHFVGNVMIDTLLKHRRDAANSPILQKLNIKKNGYCILTLHRPGNVDSKKQLEFILGILNEIQRKIKIVFPVHPRTLKNLNRFNLMKKIAGQKNLILTEPLGYLDFLKLMSDSKFVLTDSGGIQEETTVLGVPCITIRNNTERPVTVDEGTNVLVSTDRKKIIEACGRLIKGSKIKGKIPNLWDGKAAERIVKIILNK